jgi:hypothetical protein
MFLQPRQPTLANVFVLLEHIELNMIEECMDVFRFSKDNSKKNLTPSTQ